MSITLVGVLGSDTNGLQIFWLHRWDVAPLCSLRFARLKVALSAPPTILLRKNDNLFCGDIAFAVVITTARRRVQTASPRNRQKKRPPARVVFSFVG